MPLQYLNGQKPLLNRIDIVFEIQQKKYLVASTCPLQNYVSTGQIWKIVITI